MLHVFLMSNRDELMAMTPAAIGHRVPLFLLRLVDTLRAEQLNLRWEVR